jgi:hypothetical protein
MSIYRINPELLKSNGASNGDVLTYVASNAKIEWKAASGGTGDESNLYNTYTTLTANDYNSFTTLTANTYNTLLAAQANDGATLASAQANDFNSYTTLTANTYNTLLDTRANDYNSFTTLTANIYNTFAYLNANVGGGGDASNAWVNANDYATYTTLVGFINTVQDNVAAGVGGDTLSDIFTTSSSSNTFTLSQSVSEANNIIVSLNGIIQYPVLAYVVSGTSLYLANTDPIPSGYNLEVRYLSGGSGGGGGGITTGKAIAMAMIFGG